MLLGSLFLGNSFAKDLNKNDVVKARSVPKAAKISGSQEAGGLTVQNLNEVINRLISVNNSDLPQLQIVKTPYRSNSNKNAHVTKAVNYFSALRIKSSSINGSSNNLNNNLAGHLKSTLQNMVNNKQARSK